MSKATVDVGIVGLGEVARMHLKTWRKIESACMVAVCDSREQTAKETANKWNIPAYYTDFSEMLRRQTPSVVDICTPPQTHCALIVQALKSGCHVIVEKPLAMTTEEVKKIISTQKESKTKLGVIHNNLFRPVMVKALSLIQRGELGKIINVDLRFVAPPNDPMLSNKNHWCHSLPGGRFGEFLAHPIYILQAILGQMKVKSVHAMKVGSYPWVPFDELWVNLEGDKGYGSIYASFNSVRDAWSVDVYGTRGILKLSLDNETLVLLKRNPITRLSRALDILQQAYQLLFSTAQNGVSLLFGNWQMGHEVCLQAFLDSVLNDKAPLVTLQEAYDSVETLEKICKQINVPFQTTP